MKYLTQPKFRKYVKGYRFLSLAIKFGDKYVKKLMDAATKAGIDAAKTASKRVVQKTAEATTDLIGSKIADKITSLGKKKVQKKKKRYKKSTYHQNHQIKDRKLLMTWDCFKHHIKMEYQKITNLLGTTLDEIPRFITKKWVEVHDQSGSADDRYKPNKQIRFKTSMLRSDLCDYSDAYIVVKGTITVTDPNKANYDKKLAFKNNAPFTSCISKINNTLIDNAEDLDIVIPMFNLLEYSKNYKKTTGSLWNYYRDEPNNSIGGRNNNVDYSIEDSNSFHNYRKISRY